MQQKANATVPPDRESKCLFGSSYENSFILSDNSHYVIAPDASDLRRILVEDLSTGASFGFGENQGNIKTLFFDQDSRTLLAGHQSDHLVEYGLDLQKTEGYTIKHVDVGIGLILSYSSSMGLVFFGGSRNNARVYDLARKKMLPGDIESAIQPILSLQVCVVGKSRVYLAVVGEGTIYSSTKSDLYDLGGLLGEVSILGEVVNDDHRLSCTDTDQVKTQTLHIEKLQRRVSGFDRKNKGRSLM